MVATETVEVLGTISAEGKFDLRKVILPGAGETTPDVAYKGRWNPTTGTGGSVIIEGGTGTSTVSGHEPHDEDDNTSLLAPGLSVRARKTKVDKAFLEPK